MSGEAYTGPVCYVDGWHYPVVPHPDGIGSGDEGHVYEVPDLDRRLVLDDDGGYRFAGDDDTESWHDRKHVAFKTFELEDGSISTKVTESELAAIDELLAKLRAPQ